MNSFTILILVAELSLISFGSAWVFTDVNYQKMIKAHGVDLGATEENEISDDEGVQLKFSLIYPGTKWCGPGNIADSFEDLGPEVEADSCCREHDNCPDLMAAGATKQNLTNNAFYTRLSCECDETFRRCLRGANGTVAEQIGVIYFNALGTQCFREDYPIKGCRKRGGWFNKKCLQYTFDKNGEKMLQWFDVPNY